VVSLENVMPEAGTRVRNLSRLLCALISLLVIISYQITKAMVVRSLPEGALVPVLPGFFNLTHTTNTGVAFGMFSGSPAPWKTVLLVAVSAALIVVVVYLISRSRQILWGATVGFGLVLGGAISNNLMDRVRTGQVVDFLDFYWRSYHWYAFNLADSAIVVGAGILLFEIILAE
jgi:signal peptidase II